MAQVHNDRTVPIKISAIRPLNKGYIAYFPLRMRHMAMSTSGLKSDVTIVFLDTISYNQCKKLISLKRIVRAT